MTAAERRVRMRRLRAAVHGHDVFRWAARFLDALGAREGGGVTAAAVMR
jgi:trehalose-6-phosphate synthase